MRACLGRRGTLRLGSLGRALACQRQCAYPAVLCTRGAVRRQLQAWQRLTPSGTPSLRPLLPAAQPWGTGACLGQHGAGTAAAAGAHRGGGGDWSGTCHGGAAAAQRERCGGAAGAGGRPRRRSRRAGGGHWRWRSASGGAIASSKEGTRRGQHRYTVDCCMAKQCCSWVKQHIAAFIGLYIGGCCFVSLTNRSSHAAALTFVEAADDVKLPRSFATPC